MEWFFLALGAPFLWSLVNISDQYLVENYGKGKHGPGALVIFSCLIGIVVAGIILIFVDGIFKISLTDKLLLTGVSAVTVVWTILYLIALKKDDVSTVVPWFLTVPIFGYIFGYIFLGETLSTQQLVGSLIILAGVSLITFDFSGKKTEFKLGMAIYMILVCVLIALSGVVFKYVTVGNDFWVSSFWQYLALGVFGILLFLCVPKFRHEFMEMNKKGGMKIFNLNMGSEVTTVVGNLLTNYATLLGPITMVYLVGTFQPGIVLIFTIIGTKFFPKIIQEDLDKRILIPKIAAILIMIVGSIVLFI